MSKRSSNKDNSKRQQPVQQQRAEAARQAQGQAKSNKNQQPMQERSREKSGG